MLKSGADKQAKAPEPHDGRASSPSIMNSLGSFRSGVNPFDIGDKSLSEGVMKVDGIGLRMAFRIPILLLAVVTFLIVAAFNYWSVTNDEMAKADRSIHSEVNYLCLQLQSLDERKDALERIAGDSGTTPAELAVSNPDEYLLLSDPVGDVLSGYTLEETGTVAIAVGDVVTASDDDRLPVGSHLRESLGEAAHDAVVASVETGQLQEISLEGVLAPANAGSGDSDGYLLAGQQGEYTVVIVMPSGMVFEERDTTMVRQSLISLAILIVVCLALDRLLSYFVARRIDMTNTSLERITEGDLNERVEEWGTREFKSLARGINATVDALAAWIAEAESRMDAELATAKAIQEAALPNTFPPFPDIPRFDIYASMDAAREVGGDFYDFFLVGDDCTSDKGKLAFVVADVSGKGVPAALFMMRAKAFIRDCMNSDPDLGAAVAEANRRICEGNDAGMFVTAWIGVLDYATGHIDFVNAGHNPPLLRKHDGTWQWISEKSGMVLGLFEMDYSAYSIECEPGDELLLYTDGVTEAYDVDGALYGEDRLLALVEASGALHPQELQRIVRDDVAAHAEGAEQSDDVTIMALEIGNWQ